MNHTSLNKKNNTSNLVNELHTYINSIFDYVNNPTPNTNILSIIKSISTNPNISSLLNSKMNIEEIINDYLKEIPKNTSNQNKNINSLFNNFFSNQNIQIIRENKQNNVNTPNVKTSNSNTSSKMVRKQSVIIKPNELEALQNKKEKNGTYVIIYKDGKKINFAFQEFLSNIKNNDDYYILALINIIRKIYVDILIKIITKKEYYNCQQASGVNSPCSVVAVGSQKLSSNYDVTISGVIYPHKIVSMFNKIFIFYWNQLSSIVFDTNLYGSTFFITVNEKNITDDILIGYQKTESLINSSKSILYLPPFIINGQSYSKDSINKRQMSWLIVKIFLHSYMYKIPENTVPLFNIIELLKTLLSKNNSNHQKFVDFIFRKKFNLENKVTNPRETIITEYNSVFIDKYQDSLVDIERDQLEYHSILRESSSSGNAILDKLNELIESISYSNFYGAETYFCMGTIYHVLGYIQKLANFNLDPIEYYISAIENFIDMYRYYEKMTNDSQYAIIKMSKYALRVYDALTHIDIENQMIKQNIKQKRDLFENILTKFKGQHSFHTNNSQNRTETNLRTTFTNSTQSVNGTQSSENIDFTLLLQNILQTMYNDIKSYQSRFTETIQNKINIT
jgi:hypothetical protein